ncbi:MAG: hypothetical protein B7733_11435 [Myxococcales bacterium FL481]|nr:MAG: hypothetical protein B7733_11435 [Myxococcales bacterium FL481]
MPSSLVTRRRLARFREAAPWAGLVLTVVAMHEPAVTPLGPPAPALPALGETTHPSVTADAPPPGPTAPVVSPEVTTSGPASAQPASTPPAIRALALMVDEHTIQLSATPDRRWGRGPLRALRETALIAAERDVDRRRLPDDLRAMLSQSIDVYGSNGRVCTATIAPQPRLALRFNGWLDRFFESEQETEDWYDQGRLPDDLEARIGDEFTAFVVADIESEQDCDGALWARVSSLPAPTVLTRVEPTGVEATQLLEVKRTVRRSAPYQTMRDEYEAFRLAADGDLPPWAMFLSQHHSLDLWRDTAGTHTRVHVAYGDFEHTCGDGFGANVAELYSFGAAGQVSEPMPARPSIAAMVDANDDGELESIVHDGAGLTVVDAIGNPLRSTSTPFFGCGC